MLTRTEADPKVPKSLVLLMWVVEAPAGSQPKVAPAKKADRLPENKADPPHIAVRRKVIVAARKERARAKEKGRTPERQYVYRPQPRTATD